MISIFIQTLIFLLIVSPPNISAQPTNLFTGSLTGGVRNAEDSEASSEIALSNLYDDDLQTKVGINASFFQMNIQTSLLSSVQTGTVFLHADYADLQTVKVLVRQNDILTADLSE